MGVSLANDVIGYCTKRGSPESYTSSFLMHATHVTNPCGVYVLIRCTLGF